MNQKKASDAESSPENDLRHKAEQRLRRRTAASVEEMAEVDAQTLVHELQVHQIELEMQNEELLRAQTALHDASDKYRDLFDFAPIGYFSLDLHGQILEVNLAGAALLGMDRSTAVRTRLGQFLAAEHRAPFAEFCRQVLETDGKQTCQVELLRGGKPMFLLIEGIAARDRQDREQFCRVAAVDITAQMRAEEEIRSLAEFPNENPHPILRASENGTVWYANPPAIRLLTAMGWRTGQPLIEELLQPARHVLQGGPREFDLLCAQGRTYSFVLAPSRRVGQVNFYGRDITGREQAKQVLKQAHRFTQAVLDNLSDHVAILDQRGAIIAVNESWRRFAEDLQLRTPNFALGVDYAALCEAVQGEHAEDAAAVAAAIRRLLRDKQGDFRFVYACHDECEQRWFQLQMRCFHDQSQTFVLMAHQNITEVKRVEAALRESETRWQTLAESLPAIVWTAGIAGGAEWLSPRWQEYTGQQAGQGWDWAAMLHPDDLERTLKRWKEVRRSGRPFEDEMRFRSRDDEFRWFLVRAWPVRDDGGNVVRWVGTINDIHDLKTADEALRRIREDLDRAQAVAHVGSWRLNLQRNELLWSDEVWRIFGLPQGTPLSYETFLSCVHPEDRAYVHEKWLAALRGAPYDVEHRIMAGDGIKWVRQRAELEFDPHGTPVGGFGTVQDITGRKRGEMALAAAKAAAEAASEAKTRFLANTSHELRTPMNAILGLTELALQEELSPRVRDYLQTTKQSADTLLELLNEILDVSRIEAGGFQLESASFDLKRLVDQVIKTLSVRAFEKGLEFICDLDDVPTRLVGDALRLRQVLMNLAGNAVKFTSQGAVVVSVKRIQSVPPAREAASQDDAALETAGRAANSPVPRSDEAGTVDLQFSVADTGIGISPEDQQRIFAPFVQADASTTRNFGGSGLGLTIVSKLVEFMGGRIWVESAPGKGTVFRFTVRLALQADGNDDPELPGEVREALRDLRVLVLAENPVGGRILAETLRRWSMKPETADGVPAALTKIHEAASHRQNFRLILADIALPGLDGIALAEWLRTEPWLTGPIVLMHSPPGRQLYAKRCLELGVLCLEKPISSTNLFNMITQALGIQQQAGDTADAASPFISPAPRRPLHVLLAEDTPANQKLVGYVLGRRGHHVEGVSDGQQAVELLGRQDFDVVLMDLQMPVMDGLEATRAIRNLPDRQRARLPIIAMTAHAMKGDAESCLSAGMDGYISKPVKGDELIELIERLAEQTPAKWAGPSPPTAAAPGELAPGELAPRPDAFDFDLDDALRHCLGKRALFQDLVEYLFSEADPLLDLMRTAFAKSDAVEMGKAAHRLKGTLLYLGSASALNAVQAVEDLGRRNDATGAAAAIGQLAKQVAKLKSALEPYRPAADA